MPMNIKNPETERLTRELAGVTGESLTEAVTTAVRERLDRIGGPLRRASTDAERRAELRELAAALRLRMPEPFFTEDHGDLL